MQIGIRIAISTGQGGTAGGGGEPTTALLDEAGDYLTTEAGDTLLQE